MATAIYLASKVEESPVRVDAITDCMKKNTQIHWLLPKPEEVCECEYYLLKVLDCQLLVFHPHRNLEQYAIKLDQNVTIPGTLRMQACKMTLMMYIELSMIRTIVMFAFK